MTKLHNLSLEQTDIIDEGEQRIAPEDGVMNISFTNCSNKNVVQNGSIKKKNKTCFLFSRIGKSFQKKFMLQLSTTRLMDDHNNCHTKLGPWCSDSITAAPKSWHAKEFPCRSLEKVPRQSLLDCRRLEETQHKNLHSP